MAICAFCSIAADKIISQNSVSFTVRDELPVSPGHTLILPKRHIASIFEAAREDVIALVGGPVESEKRTRDSSLTVSISALTMALRQAKIILHLHIHIITHKGDLPDSRYGSGGYFQIKTFNGKTDTMLLIL